MSIKSLLQIILFLLIILLIGGIYFLYFYERPNLDVKFNPLVEKNTTKQDSLINEDLDRENLVEANSEIKNNLKSEGENKIVNNIKLNENSDKNNKNNEKSFLDKQEKLDEIKNLTKEIEYITSNNNGDIYKISAKYGKTNVKDTNILDLEKVGGTISSPERSEIFLVSDYAKYNYTNQNSKFYSNVEIKYDEKIIYCDNLELEISKNIAIAYGNVIVKDKKSLMKAQTIIMDIVTKDISINSSNKISIFSN